MSPQLNQTDFQTSHNACVSTSASSGSLPELTVIPTDKNVYIENCNSCVVQTGNQFDNHGLTSLASNNVYIFIGGLLAFFILKNAVTCLRSGNKEVVIKCFLKKMLKDAKRYQSFINWISILK